MMGGSDARGSSRPLHFDAGRLEMMSCLAQFSGFSEGFFGSGSGLAGPVGLLDSGLIVGQAMQWLPTWLTPIWVIAVGLALGALAALIYLRRIDSSVVHPRFGDVGRFASSRSGGVAAARSGRSPQSSAPCSCPARKSIRSRSTCR